MSLFSKIVLTMLVFLPLACVICKESDYGDKRAILGVCYILITLVLIIIRVLIFIWQA